jgi:hypothetical protein
METESIRFHPGGTESKGGKSSQKGYFRIEIEFICGIFWGTEPFIL